MKVSDCIATAKSMIGEGNEDTLLLCLNNCLDEIAAEYLPSVVTQKVKSYGKCISYLTFSDDIADVIYVKNDNGKVNFSVDEQGINVEEDGTFTVGYTVRKAAVKANETLKLPLRVTVRMLCYGIIAEYYLISGMYEDAVTWDKRFKDSLAACSYGRKEHRVRQRRWLL